MERANKVILPSLGPELAHAGPLVVALPVRPTGPLHVPGLVLPIRRELLKRLPDGSVMEVIVDVSDRVDLDASFAADGWDIIPVHESLSIRLRFRA